MLVYAFFIFLLYHSPYLTLQMQLHKTQTHSRHPRAGGDLELQTITVVFA